MGAATFRHAAAAFRSDNAGDRAALEDLMAVTGGESQRSRPGRGEQQAERRDPARNAPGYDRASLGRRHAHSRRNHQGWVRADRRHCGHALQRENPSGGRCGLYGRSYGTIEPRDTLSRGLVTNREILSRAGPPLWELYAVPARRAASRRAVRSS